MGNLESQQLEYSSTHWETILLKQDRTSDLRQQAHSLSHVRTRLHHVRILLTRGWNQLVHLWIIEGSEKVEPVPTVLMLPPQAEFQSNLLKVSGET